MESAGTAEPPSLPLQKEHLRKAPARSDAGVGAQPPPTVVKECRWDGSAHSPGARFIIRTARFEGDSPRHRAAHHSADAVAPPDEGGRRDPREPSSARFSAAFAAVVDDSSRWQCPVANPMCVERGGIIPRPSPSPPRLSPTSVSAGPCPQRQGRTS
mmetsp:Transcript_32217/g.73056  ORF Transcript_32217/g.73056 Transcript_32217/m.73056 type:complete len:157 (+) Transcript_32217:1342-1812(+)